MSGVRPCSLAADKMQVDAVATLLFCDQRPLRGPQALVDWRLDARITHMLQQGRIAGIEGERLVVGNNGKLRTDWALFFGSGASSEFGETQALTVLRDILYTCDRAGFRTVGICLESDSKDSREIYRDILGRLFADLKLKELSCQLACADETGAPR